MAPRDIRISVTVGLVRAKKVTASLASTKSLSEVVQLLEQVMASGSSCVFRGIWPTEICLSHFVEAGENSIVQERVYSFTGLVQEVRPLLEYVYWHYRMTGSPDAIMNDFPDGDPKGLSTLPLTLLARKADAQRSALNRFILEKYGVTKGELDVIDALPQERSALLIKEMGDRWFEATEGKTLGEIVRTTVVGLAL